MVVFSVFSLFSYWLKNFIMNEKEIYLFDKEKFSRERNMPFGDFITYLVGNRGKTTVLELDDFFKVKYKDIGKRKKMKVSKQDISKQRVYIKPDFFKDVNAAAIKQMYTDRLCYLNKFKDFFLFLIDGGEVNLPNTPQTREEFVVDLNALEKIKSPKARVSILSDAKNEFIIDAEISPISTGESVLAFNHIEKADKLVDVSKAIFEFDRNYVSSELILQLLGKNSHFIFRLPSDTYKKERKHMKTDDEWVDIVFNANRRRSIKNEELKAKAEELKYVNLRIVNIELDNGAIETLLTNLPNEIASPEELKELYGERWQIEKGYDVLKNKLELENFTGKKRITIEQDYLSHILMYNMLIEIKNKCNRGLARKQKYKKKKCVYRVNVNVLAGKLKTSIYEMFLTDSEKERQLIEEDIFNIAKKNLIKVKSKPSSPREKRQNSGKYPYNNRKNC
jgi:hypothetical protein